MSTRRPATQSNYNGFRHKSDISDHWRYKGYAHSQDATNLKPLPNRWKVRSGCHFGCMEYSKGIQIVGSSIDNSTNIQLCEPEVIVELQIQLSFQCILKETLFTGMWSIAKCIRIRQQTVPQVSAKSARSVRWGNADIAQRWGPRPWVQSSMSGWETSASILFGERRSRILSVWHQMRKIRKSILRKRKMFGKLFQFWFYINLLVLYMIIFRIKYI